jgi:hypothetical protein
MTRVYVDDILRIATEEPQDEAAEAARKELIELRTEIDAALGSGQAPPESPTTAHEPRASKERKSTDAAARQKTATPQSASRQQPDQ